MLSLKKDLAPLKAAAEVSIDDAAEKTRGLFITLGAGQAMVYQQKEKEAELVAASPGMNSIAQVPHIAAEAQAAGISLLDQAAIVLTKAHQWRDMSSQIELIRLDAKEKVRSATSPAAIQANIDEARAVLGGFASLALA